MGIACPETSGEPSYFVHVLFVYDSAWGFHTMNNLICRESIELIFIKITWK